jgi:Fe-S-cluster containining protein
LRVFANLTPERVSRKARGGARRRPDIIHFCFLRPEGASGMATVAKTKFRREDLKPGECLCDHCTAKCCRYFALPIETPTTFHDWEYVRWFLLHDQASVFKEDDDWYLLVHTQCKHLQPDNRCGIYSTRPVICREYSTDNCEFDDTWVYEQLLETAEQVGEYMEATLSGGGGRGARNRCARSPKPPLLPVIS